MVAVAPMRARIDAVLFDLDGTLVDTAPDLALALNLLRQEQGHAPLAYEAIRPVASHGANALVALGFGLNPDEAAFAPLRERYLRLYTDHICHHSTLFPGMAEVLDSLEQQGVPWGVVTNKPTRLTQPLMQALNLTQRCAIIVSGDTLSQSKPHPAPLQHACEQIGLETGHCLYVGDAERDITAGRAAGMPTLAALFGYIGPEDQPQQWGADGLINQPHEILEWLS